MFAKLSVKSKSPASKSGDFAPPARPMSSTVGVPSAKAAANASARLSKVPAQPAVPAPPRTAAGAAAPAASAGDASSQSQAVQASTPASRGSSTAAAPAAQASVAKPGQSVANARSSGTDSAAAPISQASVAGPRQSGVNARSSRLSFNRVASAAETLQRRAQTITNTVRSSARSVQSSNVLGTSSCGSENAARPGPPAMNAIPQRRSVRSPGFFDGPQIPAQSTDDFNDDDPLSDVRSASARVHLPQPEPEVAAEGPLSVSTRVEYSALPRGSVQDVFGLVTVTASDIPEVDAGADAERQAMDVMCVLDVSGSMTGAKIKLLQDAVRFIIDQASSTDRLSIVTFNHSAARQLRLRRMDAEGKSEATAATLRLVASGGTSIAAGLDTAISVMERRRDRNKVSAILLLTDGQDSSARASIPTLLSRARQANCSLYAFGFGSDHDADLLANIAEQATTPFTFVEDVEHIRDAFAGTVGGLSSVVAQGIQLSLSSRATLKAVHTPFTVQRTSDTEATVLIPDIFAGERRDILVELAVPMAPVAEDAEVEDSTVLLEARVKYTDLRRDLTLQTPAAVMSAQRIDEPQPELEPDEEVSAQRERVEVTKALQEATEQSNQGNFDGAQQVLQSQESSLRSKKKQSKMSPALLLELQDASARMASRSAWERGGKAEIMDCMQMHKMQRCTNVSSSKASSVSKISKQMYCSSRAVKSIQRSKGDEL
eukprot:TRINITY_DN22828_c0_g3_i1.p1 TRINITY_DN22828_c0_g3~~TRINITY_DN22828_c0_g3_i1.p1  ORF type:complete len:717 (+),score=145.40 TRINITY_DN22828_c0_g3_i1:59-2209(+)